MDHHREVFLTISYRTANDENGFNIDGSTTPVSVSHVMPKTPAAIAGLQPGDLLVMVNGHDVSKMPLNKVQSIISYCRCSPITVKVLRPSKSENLSNQRKLSSKEGNHTRNYKDTVQNAFETALDAVSVLSGDFAIDKVQTGNSLNSSTTIYHPSHHSIDQEESHVEENPQAQSQAELLSSVLKAQHGLKDIMASLNQLTEKKKETPAETNVVFKGHLLESSAELTPGRSCPPPLMGCSSPPLPIGRSSPPPPMCRSSPPRPMGRSSSPPPMCHSSPSPPIGRPSPPPHVGHSSPPAHSPMGRSSLPPTGHSSSIDSPMGRPPLPVGCSSPPTIIDRPSSSPPPIIDRPSSPPPPIPVYNPKTPDRFLLSNKPEYKFEVKKQRHYYEQVELNDDIPNETMKGKPVSENSHQIPLPNLKKRENPIEFEKRNFDPLRANKGLPSSVHIWKTEQVLKWLKQLNPSFYDKYRDQFCHHDITGHTLLHFNQSKLQSLGITDADDRHLLGMSIAKLRLKTECKELEKLSDYKSLALV